MDLVNADLRPSLSPSPAPPWWARPAPVVLCLLAISMVRLAFVAWGPLDLSPDEAHYWEWSRRLDLSYYSKGPLVAYLIAVQTALLGTSAAAIRVGAVLSSLLGGWALYRLGCEAFRDSRPAALAVLGLQLTPMVWAGSLLMTIDPPFLALWTVALLYLHRAASREARQAWLLAGLAVGFGMLAKYAMVFVLPGLVLYGWCAGTARRWAREPAPYAGFLLAALVFSPVVVWNLERSFVSAQHVASQGLGAGLTWVHLAEFLGSQVAILTPLCAGLLAWGLWVAVREGLVRGREPYRFLAAFAVPVLGFYAAVALQGKVQANWAAAAYPSLALATAGALVERRDRLEVAGRRAQTRLLVAAGAMALAVVAAAHVTDRLGVPTRFDPTIRLVGWRELGAAVTRARATMPHPDRTFIASDRYQVTSELAFYAGGPAPAYNLNLGRRLNQYDLWEGPNGKIGWDAIYVEEGLQPPGARLSEAFERLDGPLVVDIRRGNQVVRRFALYRGHGFRGMTAPDGPVKY